MDGYTGMPRDNGGDTNIRIFAHLAWLEDRLASLCGVVDPDKRRLDAADACTTTISEMRERITRLVNRLKPSCRVDERIYEMCGRLVHARIRTREVDFEEWLLSKKLDLRDEYRTAIDENRVHVENTLRRFRSRHLEYLLGLGLQSALKYEESYLADLGNGRQESLEQFFTRLAASAATETVETAAFEQVVTRGAGGWGAAFDQFFEMLSGQFIVPPTPAMLFMGRKTGSLASCYLMNPRPADTKTAVGAVLKEVAPILQARGGVGLSLQTCNRVGVKDGAKGIAAVLKLLDSLVMSINTDSDRPTGVCVYVEPWHANVRSLLNMKGLLASEETLRCDNLFGALWMPDLFFKRFERYVSGERDVAWTLFDDRASHLADLFGDDFEREYERMEAEGVGVETVPIRDMAFAIIRSAAMTGSPFLMFKDACNRHYHLDTRGRALAGSNLCTEIIQSADETSNGVCNLASVNLPRCVGVGAGGEPVFLFGMLREAVRVAVMFVNAMMSCGNYSTEKSRRGVERHRSLGIGMQGLHTACVMLGHDLTSEPSRELNRRIAETMLLSAMTASCELCEHGLAPFEDFAASTYARGKMPFDGWEGAAVHSRREWRELRERVKRSGLFNSQFVALMPTVSSSQVTESSEGFSPVFTNLFNKVTMSGELLRPNLPLMRDLRRVFPDDRDREAALRELENAQWSVEGAFGRLPESHPLSKHRTAFEYDQKALIDMCADRAPFVDHSQSMTLFITEKADGTLPASSVMDLLMHAYKRGLKTGMYYCKVRKATNNGVFGGSGELVCTSCQL